MSGLPRGDKWGIVGLSLEPAGVNGADFSQESIYNTTPGPDFPLFLELSSHTMF